MVSDFNENRYLGVFCSEELVGNYEICIQGHFYEATIFKMAANKIVKLSMVSDFNENWYLVFFDFFGGYFGNGGIVKMTLNAISSLPINSSLQNNLRYQFSLKLENNRYLGVFWSEELVGNNEICIHGHFYDATVSKMAASKIVKLSMVWFQWTLSCTTSHVIWYSYKVS
jgi:hypothetical protein